MTFNVQNAFFLGVVLTIGIILIISFMYCFIYPRNIMTNHRQLVYDEESMINRGHSQEIITSNQLIRNDIRHKYQLK